VEEVFPGPPLKPDNPMDRADMRVWTRKLDENIHMPATATLSFVIALRETYLKAFDSREALEAHIASKPNPLNRAMHHQIAELGIDAPVVRQSLELFDKLLARMDAALALKPWLAGETFSLADVGYSPYITRLDCLQLDWLWSDRPHIADWYSRLQSRPTYKQAITDWLVTKEIDLMRQNGRNFSKTLQHMLSE